MNNKEDEINAFSKGDITKLETDAIVNTDNSSLPAGGGACGVWAEYFALQRNLPPQIQL